ncbi:DeoR family transcriptional regulator [Nitrosarchaeum koreense]|uniref:HTH deoR-type domain-containing protein n=1 Tax=Nitrosarchaeum koreense MY1 TaxID=1001994 RepID=F9CVP6_9ARCH|nr:DeoR family transcriptional regulator [Nitrosarchaeum koreense]EGP93348.1 hypothetical protein MY1_0583 [Nitrosarchaeum koreense MY1]
MSSLNQILVKYLKTNHTQYATLDDVPRFREYFLNYLQVIWKTPEENLEIRYKNTCKSLSEGKAMRDIRLGAVYGLIFHCNVKQYQIAHLVGVSVRTIRRDMNYLHKQIYEK